MHRKVAVLGAGSLLLAGISAQVLAHHGWGGQERGQMDISGTVHEAAQISGPHGSMQIEDPNGQIWDITLASGSRAQRADLVDDVFPVGAAVTVRGNRNDDPNRYELKSVRVTMDGKNFDLYPERL